eukprot:COSAG06_NODE_3245_length_5623_cov_14.623823_3_plen_144_part_00
MHVSVVVRSMRAPAMRLVPTAATETSQNRASSSRAGERAYTEEQRFSSSAFWFSASFFHFQKEGAFANAFCSRSPASWRTYAFIYVRTALSPFAWGASCQRVGGRGRAVGRERAPPEGGGVRHSGVGNARVVFAVRGATGGRR